ncbi:duodenase-1-like [Ciconia maguari]
MLLLLLLASAFLLVPWAGTAQTVRDTSDALQPKQAYMACLLIQNVPYESACGGFLICQDSVLSAAHCVAGKMKVNITVTLGAHNVNKKELSQQAFHVGHCVIHPNYSGDTLVNDSMLLKICPHTSLLPNRSHLPHFPNPNVLPVTICKVSGWGKTPIRGKTTSVLMEMDLKVQHEEMCEMPFKHYRPAPMIYAGDENGKKPSFHGDSGGPLVCNGKVHGIFYYGHKYSIFPEVLTRVSYFEPWICEELRKFALQDLPDSPSSV